MQVKMDLVTSPHHRRIRVQFDQCFGLGNDRSERSKYFTMCSVFPDVFFEDFMPSGWALLLTTCNVFYHYFANYHYFSHFQAYLFISSSSATTTATSSLIYYVMCLEARFYEYLASSDVKIK
jgi:hypothetical protein